MYNDNNIKKKKNVDDEEVHLTHTRKRPRVQDSPFLTTMEDDPTEQAQEISKEGFSFENEATAVVEKMDEETIGIHESVTMVLHSRYYLVIIDNPYTNMRVLSRITFALKQWP